MELNSLKISKGPVDEKLTINGSNIKIQKEVLDADEQTSNSSFTNKASFSMNHVKQNFNIYRNIVCAVLYFCYYGYAMYCHFGDEASIRLTVCTGFGTFLILWTLLKPTSTRSNLSSFIRELESCYKFGRRPLLIRWFDI